MLTFRNRLCNSDPDTISQIAASTGFFDESDIEINKTLADNVLCCRDQNHEYILAEFNGKVAGYVCFGELSDAREGTYEIFWLSVDNQFRGCGIGHQIINKLIYELKRRGASKLYLKTDSKEQYRPTRNFYEKCGFIKEAVLKGYYEDSDDCCIYSLDLREAIPYFAENFYKAAE